MTDRKPIVLDSTHGQQEQIQSGDTLQLQACVAGGASLNMPEGTTPTSPSDGDMWTTSAGLFVRIAGATIGPLGTGGGGGGGGTYDPLDQKVPASASFSTTFNSPTVTDHAKIGLHLTGSNGGTALRCALKSLASDKTVIVRLNATLTGGNTSAGIMMRNSSTGKCVSFGPCYNGGNVFNSLQWSSVSAAVSDISDPACRGGFTNVWLKLVYASSGTTLAGYFSYDGFTWAPAFSGNTYGGALDQVGFYMWSTNSASGFEAGALFTYYSDGSADGTQLVLVTP